AYDHVAKAPRGRFLLVAPAIAEAYEEGRDDVAHDHVRDRHAVDRAAVHRQDRDPPALGGGRRVVVLGRAAVEQAVGQQDLPEVARAFGPELEAVRGTAHPAV